MEPNLEANECYIMITMFNILYIIIYIYNYIIYKYIVSDEALHPSQMLLHGVHFHEKSSEALGQCRGLGDDIVAVAMFAPQGSLLHRVFFFFLFFVSLNDAIIKIN